MYIHSHSNGLIKQKIKGPTLKQVKSMHYLGPGVDVDENLTWEVYVKSVKIILSYTLYTLNKASKVINSTLLNMIYTRSIQLCLYYACSVWRNCSEGSKFSLLRLQKQAARIFIKTLIMKIRMGFNW